MDTMFKNSLLLEALDGNDYEHDVNPYLVRGKSVLARMKAGSLAYLVIVSEISENPGMWQIKLKELILLLQLVSINFRPGLAFAWSPWVLENVTPVFQAITLENVWRGSPITSLYSVIAICGFFGLYCAYTFWVVLKFSDQKTSQQRKFLTRNTGHISPMFGPVMTMSHMPIMLFLLGVLNGEPLSSVEAGTVTHSILKGLALVTFVLFFIFTGLISIIRADLNPLSKNELALVHSRVEFFSCITKSVLVIVVVVSRFGALTQAVVMVVCSFMIFWARLKFLPFYSSRVNYVMVGSSSLLCWASLCTLAESLLDNRTDDLGAFMPFVMGGLLVYNASISLVQARVRYLQKVDISTLSAHDPAYAELVIRHRYPPKTTKWQYVVEMLRDMMGDKFNQSRFFTLIVTTWMGTWGGNQLLASQNFRLLRGSSLQFDEIFYVFRQRMYENERSGGQNSAFNFVLVEQYQSEARKYLLQSLSRIVQNWTLLNKPHTTISEIMAYGTAFRTVASRTRKNLEDLLELNHESASTLKLYAWFLDYVANDKYSANVLMQKMDDLVQNDGTRDGEFGNHDAAQMRIYGSTENLGIIIEVNEAATRLFGCSRDDLIGKNISTLCPPPIDMVHNMLLQQFLETQTTFKTINRPIWGLHKLGHVIPLILEVTPIIDEDGEILFSASFQPNLEYVRDLIVLDPDSMHLLFASETAYRNLLGIKPNPTKLSLGEFEFSQLPPIGSIFQYIADTEENRNSMQALGAGKNASQEIRFVKEQCIVESVTYSFNVTLRNGKKREVRCLLLKCNPEVKMKTDDSSKMNNDLQSVKSSNFSFSLKKGRRESFSAVKSLNSFNDEAQSIASSHADSQTSKKNLRKSVYRMLEKASLRDVTKMKQYKRICTWAVVICVIVVTVDWVNRSSASGKHLTGVTLLMESVLRAYSVIQALTMLKLTIMMSTDETVAVEKRLRMQNGLVNTNNKLIETHMDLSRKSELLPALELLVASQSIPLLNASSIDSFNTVSLHVGIHELYAELKRFLNENELPQGNTTLSCDKSCLYVVKNAAMPEYHACMNASRIYSDMLSQDLKSSAHYHDLNLVIAVIVWLVFVAMCILPVVIRSWKIQQRTAVALLSIPKHSLKLLTKVSKTRLTDLTNKISSEHDDIAKDPIARTIDSMTGQNQNKCAPKEFETVLNALEDTEDNFDEKNAQKRGNERSKSRSLVATMTFQRGTGMKSQIKVAPESLDVDSAPRKNRPGCVLVIKWLLYHIFQTVFVLGMPFITTVLYLGFMSIWANYMHEHTEMMNNMVLVSGERLVNAQYLFFAYTLDENDIDSTSGWGEFSSREEVLKFARDLLDKSHNDVMYGNSEENIGKMDSITDNPLQLALNFENACLSRCQENKDSPGNKELSKGLNAGVKYLLDTVEADLQGLVLDYEEVVPLITRHEDNMALIEALKQSCEYFIQDIEDSQSTRMYWARVVLAGYFVLLAVSGVYSLRKLNEMDERMKNIQCLLLMVPSKIIKNIPAIRAIFARSKEIYDPSGPSRFPNAS